MPSRSKSANRSWNWLRSPKKSCFSLSGLRPTIICLKFASIVSWQSMAESYSSAVATQQREYLSKHDVPAIMQTLLSHAVSSRAEQPLLAISQEAVRLFEYKGGAHTQPVSFYVVWLLFCCVIRAM